MKMFTRFWAVISAAFLSMFVSAQSYALTCTDTSPTSICNLVTTEISFDDIKEAIFVLTIGLAGLSLILFGARTIIRWARGRTS